MPDLNSVPPSPHSHSQAVSRLHAVQHTSPESAAPITTSDSMLHILPSNQSALNHGAASHSPAATAMSQIETVHPPHPPLSPDSLSEHAFAAGPGPLRHPRPLTASELHMKLEKEQEQIVRNCKLAIQSLFQAHMVSILTVQGQPALS